MSVNSLSNFGVPGLGGERSPVLQPIFSNKFRTLFYNFGATGEPAPYDLTRQMLRMNRPQTQFEVQTLYSYVSTIYVVSRGEHQEMTLVFRDDITNSVTRRVENQKAKQQNFYDQTMSRAGENYKFEMDLDVLAGGASAGNSASDPNILQKWSYSGCMLTNVDFGEMNQENATAMEIVCTVRYDNVIGTDQNGVRMGNFSHSEEIESQSGNLTTAGASGGIGINISGGSVSIGGSGLDIGGATVGGDIGTGGGGFGINF